MALAPIDFPNDPDYGDSFEASNGITYTWLGNRWRTNVGSVDINVNPEDITFNTLADVSVANPTSDDIVYWNNQNGLWEAKQLSEWLPNQSNIVFSDQNTNITGEFNFVTDPLLDLSQLHDVTVTDPQIGDTIKWSGTAGGWVNGPACETDAESEPDEPIKLADLEDVELMNPTNNQVLKYDRQSQKWRNALDEVGTPGPSPEPTPTPDLTDYTKRNEPEDITRGWTWHVPEGEGLRVQKADDDKDNSFAALGRSGKLTLHGGAQGSITDASIIFESDLTERQPWPFETKIQLTKVPVVKSDAYDDIIGLACIGGGITFMENDQDENNKLGLINITPRGLDIKRVTGSKERVGAIDWKVTDNLTTADPTFDVRMRMTNINIGGEEPNIDNEPGLSVMGNGMVIVPTEDDASNKQGHVYITPKFIDITRADGKPRIRFSDRAEGLNYESNPAFGEIGGNNGNLFIKCLQGEVFIQDRNGNWSPSRTGALIEALTARLTAAEAKIAALEGNQGGY